MYINKKKAVPITFNGKTQSLYRWSLETGIPYITLHQRIKKLGWSLKRAFSEKVQSKVKRLITYNNKTLNLNEWSKKLRIPYPILYQMVVYEECNVQKVFSSILNKEEIE
jgi:hypothetical protein